MGTYTNSSSQSNTHTEARVKHVVGKVFQDAINLLATKLVTQQRINKWKDDLTYLMNKQVLSFFEFQFKKPDGTEIGGLKYVVQSNGNIYTDDPSGGNDFFNLPSNTRVNLFAHLDHTAKNYQEANEELERRGWGVGKQLNGNSENHGSYSKDGYGVNRFKIGEW